MAVSGVLIDAPAHAGALGLSLGDEVSSIEFDSLKSVSGDGASWDVSEMLFHADGRITEVSLDGGGMLYPTGVDLTFDLGLASQNVYINVLRMQVFANASMPGKYDPGVSFSILNSSGVILNGNFSSDIWVEGNIDLTDGSQTLSATGIVTILGGNTNLVNALGGIGANATLLMQQSMFGFNPNIENLVYPSGNAFSTDFTVSLSGSITPFNPSPFVPEPSTALLLGGGMLGILALSRRLRGRC